MPPPHRPPSGCRSRFFRVALLVLSGLPGEGEVVRDQPRRLITRGGPDCGPNAAAATRIPPGHPEGFYEAFANLYRGVIEAIRATRDGRTPTGLAAQFPTVQDGLRGVRFIELTCPGGNGDRWDQHGGLKDGHTKNALSVDQPIAALLADLAQRGLLDSTLIVWAGEFGRTPFAQGNDGRDHNPFGYTIWMAGGGIKGGTVYGATDEYGYKVVEDRLEMHDLHATMLHLLGVDHTQQTFRFSGRDMRLTDVHGHVVKEILA